jgi:benzaldehyde dehydrogenase (NAD)
MAVQSDHLGSGHILDSAPWSARVFDGRWVSSRGGAIDVNAPATGQVLTRIGLANGDDIAAAAGQAALAQPGWVRVAAGERGQVFQRAAAYLEQHGEEIARFIARETGSTRVQSQREVSAAVAHVKAAASIVLPPEGVVLPGTPGRLRIARRAPLGVIGVISTFSFPLLSSLRSVAPALAAGNAVVLQPDARAAVAGGYIVALAFQAAGLPAGLLHVLPVDAQATEAAEALCTDTNVQMIAFTGSIATGRRVGELAARQLKKVALELVGKSSLIVLEDADLELAASNVTWNAHLHQGQICMATGRVLVHEKAAPALIERLVARARQVASGARGNGALSPLIDERQRERVCSLVAQAVDAGAQLEVGGSCDGLFYAPTVLSAVRPGMAAFREELFGPVATITTFATDEAAIALANEEEPGLYAAVISPAVGRAMAIAERLRSRSVAVNEAALDEESGPPWGATASSALEDGGGPADVDGYTRWRWMTLEDSASPYPF